MNNVTKYYRADVDGLRAIAILSVVIFHAFPALFPGGYAGVDVFFVISGYLITSIILRQNRDKTFSFIEFYLKRVIRLFPSLGIVLFSTLVAGWFFLLPAEFKPLGKHATSGAGFLANISLYKEVGYFNSSSDMKPLLHLWSLGIEEQFYFFWPLILFITWKKFPAKIVWICIALISISFILNVTKVSIKPEYTFYMPQTRFWELFVGCFLATIEFKGLKSFSKLSSFFSLIGFLLISTSFILLTKTSKFPGYWALLPVFGTGLVVYAGPHAYLNRMFFSNRILVFIGLISYPLYLWHWPLLSFNTVINNGEGPAKERAALLVLSIVFAILTYRFFEIPSRNYFYKKKWLVTISLTGLVLVSGLMGLLIWKGIIVPFHSGPEYQLISDAKGDWDFPGRMTVEKDIHGNRIWRQGTNSLEAVFIGDSNIQQYYPRLEKVLKDEPDSLSIRFFTIGGCPPFPQVHLEGRYSQCKNIIEEGYEYSFRPNVKSVIIGAQWIKMFSDEHKVYLGSELISEKGAGYKKALQGFIEIIKKLKSNGKRVYVVLNIPVGEEFDPFSQISRNFSFPSISWNKKMVSRYEWESKYKHTFDVIENAAKEAGAKVINPLDYFCKGGNCSIMTDTGKPIYKDVGHIRPYYIIEHAQFMDETIK
ncbi:MAG: acyltransferase family protein [Bdellovibrionota bacterium]